MGLYHNRLFELAAEIPPYRQIQGTVTAEKISRLCGSRIGLTLIIDDDGNIQNLDMDVKACALGQASAGIFAKYAIGANYEAVKLARSQLWAMLKEDAPAPTGQFWELRYLQSVADFPPRHASVMLVFDAAIEAFEKFRALEKE